MSKIFKRNSINVDEDNKVYIKHTGIDDIYHESEETPVVYDEDFSEPNPIEEKILDEARQKARLIIEEAQKTSTDILILADEKRQQIYTEAKTEGYNEGYSEGHKKGYDDGNSEGVNAYDELKDEVTKTLIELDEKRENLASEVEKDMVDLVIDIVSNITYNAFELREDLLTVLVRRGINNATIQNKVSIKVSEFDYDAVVKNFDEFTKLVDSSKEIEVLKDFSLQKNDCLLETEFGNINCGLDEQLNSIRESLYLILNDK